MNATSETTTATSRGVDQQTFIVLGVLLQFLSTPEQINDHISVMRGTVPPGVVIPLHSHADPEKKQAEHGTELYQISDWKYCCKLLIPQSARVLARHNLP